jgi:Indigoidine synthase A like protein
MFLRLHRHALTRVSRGWHRSYSLPGAHIDVSPEVKDALHHGSPVVALESTIITHGMPHPTNLETALSVERKVRSAGSVPATIGVLDGRIVVGLQRPQLERLAEGNGKPDLVKLSRRDLAAAVGLGKSGGTTIAATSLIASLVGIRVSLGRSSFGPRAVCDAIRSLLLVALEVSIVADNKVGIYLQTSLRCFFLLFKLAQAHL